MADLGFLLGELKGLPASIQPTMTRIVRALVKMRFGHPTADAPIPMVNVDGGMASGTTAAIAGDEFTVEHGLGRTPYLVWAVLPLDVVGAQLVPLEVTRVADARRIYLKSTKVSAPFCVAYEG